MITSLSSCLVKKGENAGVHLCCLKEQRQAAEWQPGGQFPWTNPAVDTLTILLAQLSPRISPSKEAPAFLLTKMEQLRLEHMEETITSRAVDHTFYATKDCGKSLKPNCT